MVEPIYEQLVADVPAEKRPRPARCETFRYGQPVFCARMDEQMISSTSRSDSPSLVLTCSQVASRGSPASVVRLVDRHRIKRFRFSQSPFQFGKASIEFIVIHFLHHAEYVLDDQRVLEHLQTQEDLRCLCSEKFRSG